jgi:hypothetical protein
MKLIRIVTAIVTLLAIAFAVVSLFLWSAPDRIKKGVLVAWTVLPPVWFFTEWQFLLKSGEGENDFWFNRFKYSQAGKSGVGEIRGEIRAG